MRLLLARAVHWLALRSGHALRQARRVRKPRILMYHAVSDDETSAELFAWQLRVLRDEFEPVSLPTLLDRMTAGSVTGDEVVITFDDGVRNHVSSAYPLLVEHGMPATFFVCPGLIDSGHWVWNMELRLRLMLLTDAERTWLAQSIGCPDPGTESLVEWAKRLDFDQRQQLEAQVQSSTREFEPTAAQVDRYAPMTWGQACGLDPALVTLGSHSLSHPMLTTLSEAQLRTEIAGSRALLEHRTGRIADLFCYPNGDNDASTVAAASDNYRAAVTARSGFVGADAALHQLPRIPAGERPGLFMRRLHHPGA